MSGISNFICKPTAAEVVELCESVTDKNFVTDAEKTQLGTDVIHTAASVKSAIETLAGGVDIISLDNFKEGSTNLILTAAERALIANGELPVGAILDWPKHVALPTGWMWWRKEAKNTITYANLFAKIGYTYGGSGTTFFLGENSTAALFLAITGTQKNYLGMCRNANKDIYVAVYGGDIYKQTEGVGDFIAMGQISRNWYGMCADAAGNVYAAVYQNDIYKQTGGVGNFIGMGQNSRNWSDMCVDAAGNVYAAEYGGDIYKQTGGVGNFIAMGQTSRNWYGMCADAAGNVYAAVKGGDIYKQTGGAGNFLAMGQTSRNWSGMCPNFDGEIYAAVSGGELFKLSESTAKIVKY